MRIFTLLFLAALALRAEAPLQLAPGQAMPVFVSGSADQTEVFAAGELARYLSKISGQPFRVQAAGAALPVQGLLVGRAFADAMGENLTPDRLGYDGIRLKRTGPRILIAGAGERGTLYAAYAFLERLGCGWYAPNFAFYGAAGGEHVPRIEHVAVGELDVVEKPSFRWRKKYVEEGETHDLPTLLALIDWMAKSRLNVLSCAINYQGEGRTKWDNWRKELIPEIKKRGLMLEVGGHGYQIFLPAARYFGQHPEWFGMDHGKRSDDPKVVFSTANPEAVGAYIEGVRAYLRAHPEIDIFDCRPPDSSHWSTAPEDEALGTSTDRQLMLVNRLAQELKGEFPRLKVRFEAYSALLEPPVKVRPAEGTLMEFCPIDRSFRGPLFGGDIAVNQRYSRLLKGWLNGVVDPGAVTIATYITKYQWRSLPILIPHLISQEARHYASIHLGGMASYSEPGAWAALELDHYTLARCLWNAELDPDAELTGYARGRYGKAAAPVLQYLNLVEAVIPNAVVIPGTILEFRSEQKYLAQFRAAERLIASARSAAGNDAAVQVLIEKLDGSRRYAENELQLRLAFLEAGTTWRRSQLTKLEALLAERHKIVESNRREGLMVVDARTW